MVLSLIKTLQDPKKFENLYSSRPICLHVDGAMIKMQTVLFVAEKREFLFKIWMMFKFVSISINIWLQEKVFEEMSSISGPSEEDVAVAEIKQMTYLEQVIKETLRLFPVIPLISRTVKEDLELSE